MERRWFSCLSSLTSSTSRYHRKPDKLTLCIILELAKKLNMTSAPKKSGLDLFIDPIQKKHNIVLTGAVKNSVFNLKSGDRAEGSGDSLAGRQRDL